MRRAGRITRQGAGKPISAAMLRDLAAGVVRRVSGVGVRATSREDGSLTISADRQLKRAPISRMRVDGLHNEYLTCTRMSRGVAITGHVSVLKPYMLSHQLSHYQGLGGITTVSTETIDTSGSFVTRWTIEPKYSPTATGLIWAYNCYTGELDDDSDPIDWIDLNVDGRHWIDIDLHLW